MQSGGSILYTKEKSKRAVTWFCMAAMFLFAISVSMIGLVLPEVTEEFGVSLSEAGIVTTAQNAGGMLALAVCGMLADRYGKGKVITTLFIGMTAALLYCYEVQAFPGFILAAMILGLTSSSLNACIAAHLADLFPERSDHYINLAGVLFGLGSVLGPVYVGITRGAAKGWRDQFGSVGAVAAAVLLVFILAASPHGRRDCPASRQDREERGRQADGESFFKLLQCRRFWYYAAIGFFYMAHSSAFMAWIPTCLAFRYPSERVMTEGIMTIYWIGILAGRILIVWRAEKLKFDKFMIVANGVGGIGVLSGIVAGGWTLAAVYAVVGVATGAVFQVCLAGVCEEFPHMSGRASSFVALAACIGGTLSCYLTGILADTSGFTAAQGFLGVLLLWIVPIILSDHRKGELQR